MLLQDTQTINASTSLISPKISVDMSRVATIILAGGNGTRLEPLTMTRCKPAVCFGGKYRLIDIPVSNAIHSGCSKIFIISQYLSASLHQHIFNTYHPGAFSSTAIELLSAEQKHGCKSWFQGTACAIRQNLNYLTEIPAEYFLILSGDQIYNMNFQHMIQFAKESDADLVVAALPVNEDDAKRMGIMKLDKHNFITEFYEKPQEIELLNHLRLPTSTLEQIARDDCDDREFLGSMGIYVFKRHALLDLLLCDPREDFGKHLIPTKVSQGNIAAYLHNGYWEDIGTIESFFKANIALTASNPEFNCCEDKKHIFFRQYYLSAPKIENSTIANSIICEGSFVEAAEVTNSILGLRSVIKQGSIIRHSYIMGNDFYTSPKSDDISNTLLIGENCIVDHAIIDKNVHIGKNVQLINKNKLMNYSSDKICIRDGIIIVPRGTHLPDGFIL
jgi:glucose-1-phosphate adenylyltransferase